MKSTAIAAGLLLATSLGPALAQSAIYKCVAPNGAVEYQSFSGQGCRRLSLPTEGTVTAMASSGGSGNPGSSGSSGAGGGSAASGMAGGGTTLSFGMTRDEVAGRLGMPGGVTRTQTRQGTSEQWLYDGGKRVLTFRNGALEAIQY